MAEKTEAQRAKAREYAKRYYAEHREERIAYQKGYAKANSDKRQAINARYRAAHREEINTRAAEKRASDPDGYRRQQRELARAWRSENRELSRERNRRWDAGHRERRNAARRSAYAGNSDAQIAAVREYQKAHPEVMRAASAKRRALAAQSGATIGDPAAIRVLYRRARENKRVKCYLCGRWIPLGERHVDHVQPLAGDGPHIGWNLAIACATCNVRKGAKPPEEIGLLL